MVEQSRPTTHKEALQKHNLFQMIRFLILMKVIACVSGVVA